MAALRDRPLPEVSAEIVGGLAQALLTVAPVKERESWSRGKSATPFDHMSLWVTECKNEEGGQHCRERMGLLRPGPLPWSSMSDEMAERCIVPATCMFYCADLRIPDDDPLWSPTPPPAEVVDNSDVDQDGAPEDDVLDI